MSNIIPFNKPETKEDCCSFCNRPESQAVHLFKSGFNSHHICIKCLKQAKQRCDETNQESETHD